MFRKPAFWIAFVVVTALLIWFSVVNFPRAFSVVQLDLEMNREGALAEAAQLIESNGWGPADARRVAAFDLDFELQSFVELEAGGKDAFAAMLDGDLASPYTWQVRSFKEFEATETTVSFTPAGAPYGFVEKLPEDQPGAALDGEAARAIAEYEAMASWSVDLSQFELVEQAQEERPGGRIDHTLVYEQPQPTVGADGRYRLRLVVSGDRFTELTRFVKVPEAFDRRYEQMRSANNGIAFGGMVLAAALYLVGGAVIGSFLLLRERWLEWRQPVLWAAVIAVVMTALSLNQFPLLWMGYDTALASGSFALQQVVLVVVQSLAMGLLFAVTVIAAEGLTRKAFPHHVQLWRSWKPRVASSRTVVGLTCAGFMLAAALIAYDVFLYGFANDRLGWWSPSSPLIDPNSLATYFPWLTSVGISLWAGFWEECAFRAIPLAGAALLGRRFGGRTWWIVGTLLLQAVIFGAGHANYPQQPAYARVVEMIVPWVGIGVVYLAFGLLPLIILHFVVDVALVSLPLFTASSPGIWVDRGMVILIALVPLWVVLRGRLVSGRFGELSDDDRNGAWRPAAAPSSAPATALPAAAGLSRGVRTVLLAAGAAGLVAWIVTADFSSVAPPLAVDRTDALTAAEQELTRRGAAVPERWRTLSTVEAQPGQADRFVWREGGRDAYRQLLGGPLDLPQWRVRRVGFEGDVAERAEEFDVWVAPDGAVRRLRHRLPEARPGATLGENEARQLARSELAARFGIDPAAVEEVAAEPTKQPERLDWRFVYRQLEGYPLDEGEARIAISIAGDEVVDGTRFVHVPEEWERADRNRETLLQLVSIVCTVLSVVVFIAGAVVAMVRWARGRFGALTFVGFFVLVLLLGVVGVGNSWPAITAQFSTAQPFELQSSIAIGGTMIALFAMAAGIGLNIGMVHRWLRPAEPVGTTTALATGAALGLAAAGLLSLGSAAAASLEPSWASYQAAGAVSPFLDAALGPITSWITTSVLVMLVLGTLDAASRGWTRGRWAWGAVVVVVVGPALAGASGTASLAEWLAGGAAAGALLLAAYVLVLRHRLALIPVAAAAMTILEQLREGSLGAYPQAFAGSLAAAALVALAGFVWYRRLARETAAQPG